MVNHQLFRSAYRLSSGFVPTDQEPVLWNSGDLRKGRRRALRVEDEPELFPRRRLGESDAPFKGGVDVFEGALEIRTMFQLGACSTPWPPPILSPPVFRSGESVMAPSAAPFGRRHPAGSRPYEHKTVGAIAAVGTGFGGPALGGPGPPPPCQRFGGTTHCRAPRALRDWEFWKPGGSVWTTAP